MSFILDALKKSENDRQRQSGPALFEVRVAAPRSKWPLPAVAIVALLVVNLGVVAWLMLRKPAVAAPAPQAATAAQPVAPPPAYATQPTPTVAQPAPVRPPAIGSAPAAAGAHPPPANSAFAPAGAGNPPANPSGYGDTPVREPTLAEEGPATQPLNPDDYEPARDPTAPLPPNESRVTRATESGLPTYEEVASRTSLPELHMDLHSYAADPTKRFVLINMKRLYEGQSLPGGAKVESITHDAAIMSYNGKRFVLNQD